METVFSLTKKDQILGFGCYDLSQWPPDDENEAQGGINHSPEAIGAFMIWLA